MNIVILKTVATFSNRFEWTTSGRYLVQADRTLPDHLPLHHHHDEEGMGTSEEDKLPPAKNDGTTIEC